MKYIITITITTAFFILYIYNNNKLIITIHIFFMFTERDQFGCELKFYLLNTNREC